jgi:pimeloyl-ACP methyl ester carboxylesterase
MTRTIVFAHANGFPAGTYEPIFDVWRAAGWRVEAPERFSHDARYPVTSNWPRLRDQLTDFIVARELAGAILVGHSLGGLVSLMAACKRPDLVGGLVMLDSPIVTGWRAHSVHMAKRTGLIERVGPGVIAKRRRHEWPSRDAVHAHFAAKSVFARWDARMLAAYVRAGFDEVRTAASVEAGAGPAGSAPVDDRTAPGADAKVVLAIHRDVEARIYNTLPHHLPALLKKHPPRCPVGFIAGTRSAEMRQGGFDGARKIAGARWRWIEGTHLYPMERPDDTAHLVLELLGTMKPVPPKPRRAPPV